MVVNWGSWERNNEQSQFNLMFLWPCIMNWLYINHQLWCTDNYLFIKYCSPLHVSSIKCSSSGGYSCTHAAYVTVTLYEISWWPVSTQLEWELTVGGRLLVGTPTNNLPPTVSSHSSCIPTGHQELSERVTVPYAACVQLYPPEDEHMRLEICRGE